MQLDACTLTMSQHVQRLIRKLQPKGPRSFDEEVWPIYVAIIVLFGYLVGIIVALLRFNESRWYANAMTWLAILSLLAVAGLFCVRLLERRFLKRTVVLSLLISLIVNVSLMIMMAWTSIMNRSWEEPVAERKTSQERREVIVPEYPLFTEEVQQRVRQEYERPVETGEVEAEERIELTRQSTVPEVELNERLPIPNKSATQNQTTSTPNRFEAPSSPRQSQTRSKLSRQTMRTELASSTTSVPTPATAQPSSQQKSNAKPKQSSAQADAQSTNVAKSYNTQSRPQADTETLQAPQQIEVAKFTRRATDDSPTPTMSSLPTLKRRMNRPREVPSTDTQIDSRVAQPKRVNKSLEPSSTLVQQRTTSAPEKMTSVDFQTKVTTDLQRQTRIDRPDAPTLSPSVERTALAKAASQTTDVDVPELQTAKQSSDVAAQSTAMSKQANPNNNQSAPAASAPRPNTQPSPSAQTFARAKATTTPSVSEALAERNSPTRSQRLANRVAQTKAEVDGAVESVAKSDAAASAPEPSRMALSRSSIGVAGVGDASNLERGLAAPDSPVSIASAAANRAESQQDMEEAFALAPSTRSPNRQMRATANQARTNMQAQPIDTAMVPGATAPSDTLASAAATLERAPSNASAGSFTAAKGNTEVDLGPTRIAADTSSGRAEGGGQPEITTGELPRALPRSDLLSGASGSRIATDTMAESPAAADVGRESDFNSNVAALESSADVAKSSTHGGQLAKGDTAGEASAPSSQTEIGGPSGGRADDEDDNQQLAASLSEGGNSRPGKRARGLQVRSDTNSSVPSMASSDASSGSRNGQPLDADGSLARQESAGLPTPSGESIGALQADEVAQGDRNGVESMQFTRQENQGGGEAGSFALSNENAGAPRRNRRIEIAGGSTDVELDPEEFAINAPSTGQDDGLDGGNMGGTVGDALAAAGEQPARQAGGAVPVDISADTGAGGLGTEVAPDVGILSRTANPDSDFVSLQPARFMRRSRPGASITAETDVALAPTKAFRRRVIRKGEQLAGERGLPSPKTEASIELGLVFLSKFQSADGSWSLNNFADGKAELPADEEAVIVSDTAATGLCLLSYLGAGYHHKADKYQEHVKGGIEFLVQHQRDDGDLYIDQDPNSSRSAWLYSHAIASIALCEAYGMTQDPKLRGPAQKAVNFIAESQHPDRGGWRYSPAYGADTSVTGWMTMALKSGELAGLAVDKRAFKKIDKWMLMAQASDEKPYLFRYNPYAQDTEKQRHGLKATRAMTAVGLLMRLYTGWGRNDPKMVMGAETLAQNLPSTGTPDRPRRDTYYWYYATQVMYHMGGDYWSKWNNALHPMLTSSQVQDGPLAGSWDPQAPIPDRWGTYGGRLYVTTMNLLSLEVFYRHLPIYEETAK